jgi:hypothetical protein
MFLFIFTNLLGSNLIQSVYHHGKYFVFLLGSFTKVNEYYSYTEIRHKRPIQGLPIDSLYSSSPFHAPQFLHI